jgi:hypothetical protein
LDLFAEMGSSLSSLDNTDWKSQNIHTCDDAMNAFIWIVRHYYCWTREERLERAEYLDEKLAAWSSSNPGEFVRMFCDNATISRLTDTPVKPGLNGEPADTNCAEIFLMCFPSIERLGVNNFPLLQNLKATIGHLGMIPILLNLCRFHRGKEFRGDLLQWIAILYERGEHIFDEAPLKGSLAPEARDTLLNCAFKTPLPNLLPSENTLSQMTQLEVDAIICQYTLESISELESRLRPGKESEHGFIGMFQHFGTTVIEDAKTLVGLKVSRHAIADMMELIIAQEATVAFRHNEKLDPERWAKITGELEKWKKQTGVDPAATFHIQSLGDNNYQSDPFHPTYDNPTSKADVEYWVMSKASCPPNTEKSDCESWPHQHTLRFSKLHPSLIRRACFFEGPGMEYRVEPAHAAKVLGLI